MTSAEGRITIGSPRTARINGKSLPLMAEDLQEILPHRMPFALLDRVTEIDPGLRATGYRHVSRNEPHFAGHFPERPILPGVLMIESLAQLAGVVLWSGATPTDSSGIGVLAWVKKFRFRRMVVPGDLVRLQAELQAASAGVTEFHVAAHVDRVAAADGVVQLALAGQQT